MSLWELLAIYILPLAVIWLLWSLRKHHKSRQAKAVLDDNVQAGLAHPSSLHPLIDPNLCLGCGACVVACPEKSILALIDGKAALVEPTSCVGHGACQAACPFDAISLVFGTEERGVDLPMVTPEFETNVPGIFIAGELGGMGLVKNAIEQGRQAIGFAAGRAREMPDAPEHHDIAIIGAGPAGISAGLGAIERSLDYIVIDQTDLGGTVAQFPRGKMVMTSPAELPIIGMVKFGEVQKEELLGFWEGVVEKTGLRLETGVRVIAIHKTTTGFRIKSSNGDILAKTVLLAIGRRGTPRKLGVPGEELPKVVYRLLDPEQYIGRKVLVVGGGDSALEAAIQIAEQPGTQVTLSYRGEAFARARKKNRNRFDALAETGTINSLLGSQVKQIRAEEVDLETASGVLTIDNDYVIICVGGILPTAFLAESGIEIETKFGTA